METLTSLPQTASDLSHGGLSVPCSFLNWYTFGEIQTANPKQAFAKGTEGEPLRMARGHLRKGAGGEDFFGKGF